MNSLTPNLVAWLALISWPVVSSILYRVKPLAEATIWTILAGQLLLPVGAFFKIEMVPQFDKSSIPNLCALLGCIIVSGKPPKFWTKFGLPEAIGCIFLVSPVITSVLNSDAVVVGGTVLPGVGIYDGLSALLSQFLTLIPFFIGRQFLRSVNDGFQILNALVVAGIAYSLLLLFEIRFSPQLHFWLYGYYPSDFIQEMREDGAFRPMVFMGHGLIASFFAMTSVVASAALWRTNGRIFGLNAGGAFTFYLGTVLYFCRSGAAMVYGLALTPVIRLADPRFQIRVAALLAGLTLFYPLMRITGEFPTKSLVSAAASISESRAASLNFRFQQEEALLLHASERPWFGWGRFGRNRVYELDWQGVGRDTSVTDGRWIITFGQFGLVGFLAEFGLLAFPIFRAAKALRFISPKPAAVYLGAICLILAVNLIDLLPNSALSPWTWLLSGSLLGISEAVHARGKLKTGRGNQVPYPAPSLFA